MQGRQPEEAESKQDGAAACSSMFSAGSVVISKRSSSTLSGADLQFDSSLMTITD